MKTLFPLAAIAALSLSACNSAPEGTEPTNTTNETAAAAAPVTLPPAVKTSHTYRCADKSLVYVDFYADDRTARLRHERGTPGTLLTAETPDGAFEAEGYSVSGSGTEVRIATPEAPEQACRA